jgi:hypothetical protein
MSDRLLAALGRLEAVLAAQRNPVLRGLAPGVPEAELRERLKEWDLDPPQDLITLFGWHNGYVQPPGEPFAGRIGSGISLLSLEQASQWYRDRVRFDIEVLIENAGWSESADWFPVALIAGTFVLMDCRRDVDSRGSVASWEFLEITESRYRPNTLAEPVEWWIDYFETGVWQWDPFQSDITDMRDPSTMPESRLFSGLA